MNGSFTGTSSIQSAATDLERARLVFESVLDVIFRQMKAMDDGDIDATKQTLTKMSDLHRAYLGVKDAERNFNDKHGLLADGEIDFDILRVEIGRKLDRLRNARGTGIVSGKPDAGRT